VSKEDRYGAYSAGFEAGKEAGRLATLKELGVDPDYKPEMSRYIVTDEGFTQVDTTRQRRTGASWLT
jgi:hypothetical protein